MLKINFWKCVVLASLTVPSYVCLTATKAKADDFDSQQVVVSDDQDPEGMGDTDDGTYVDSADDDGDVETTAGDMDSDDGGMDFPDLGSGGSGGRGGFGGRAGTGSQSSAKPYAVQLNDGRVYPFKSLKNAQAYRKQINANPNWKATLVKTKPGSKVIAKAKAPVTPKVPVTLHDGRTYLLQNQASAQKYVNQINANPAWKAQIGRQRPQLPVVHTPTLAQRPNQVHVPVVNVPHVSNNRPTIGQVLHTPGTRLQLANSGIRPTLPGAGHMNSSLPRIGAGLRGNGSALRTLGTGSRGLGSLHASSGGIRNLGSSFRSSGSGSHGIGSSFHSSGSGLGSSFHGSSFHGSSFHSSSFRPPMRLR